MVKTELGWNQDKAEMFMAIARNQVLTSPQICGLLPPLYGALHLISKVDPVVLEAKLKDGTFRSVGGGALKLRSARRGLKRSGPFSSIPSRFLQTPRSDQLSCLSRLRQPAPYPIQSGS